MADAPDLGSGALGRMSSSLFARTNLPNGFPFVCGSSSVVECHLAKVDVASSNLVYRSTLFLRVRPLPVRLGIAMVAGARRAPRAGVAQW